MIDRKERGFIGYLKVDSKKHVIPKNDTIGSDSKVVMTLLGDAKYSPYFMFHTHPCDSRESTKQSINLSVQDWVTFLTVPTIEMTIVGSVAGDLVALCKTAESEGAQRLSLSLGNNPLFESFFGGAGKAQDAKEVSAEVEKIFNDVARRFPSFNSGYKADMATAAIAARFKLNRYEAAANEKILVKQ